MRIRWTLAAADDLEPIHPSTTISANTDLFWLEPQ